VLLRLEGHALDQGAAGECAAIALGDTQPTRAPDGRLLRWPLIGAGGGGWWRHEQQQQDADKLPEHQQHHATQAAAPRPSAGPTTVFVPRNF